MGRDGTSEKPPRSDEGKICILMSTYNGERFIEQQLESILSQDIAMPLSFFIRDDGSSDGTLETIKVLAEKRKIDVEVIRGNNLGPSGSFLDLIAHAPKASYYAFCDQDDVWLPGKLKAATDALGMWDVPALWASNYHVADSGLKIIEENALEHPVEDPLQALFYNNIPGCGMVFNQALLLEIQKFEMRQFRMHDIMALSVAMLSGKVLYDPRPYFAYRQHEGNAVGQYHKKVRPIRWIRGKLQEVLSKKSFHYSEFAKKILCLYHGSLSAEQWNEYALIANYKNGINRLRLLKKPYVKGLGGRTAISIKMRILLGKI